MTKVLNINDRGTLTLPKEMRRRLGVDGNAQVVAEETDEGILIRPGGTFPVELYSEKRLAEFRRNNEESLAGYRLSWTEVPSKAGMSYIVPCERGLHIPSVAGRFGRQHNRKDAPQSGCDAPSVKSRQKSK